MARALQDIKSPISKELEAFESHFKKAMKSQVALLDKIMYYIIRRKGKRVRPMFVFLSARMCGEIGPSTYTAASLIELLHTATLVHDDVVDDAHKRRGMFSINALWKNKIAVLVGDYLLSRGLLLAIDNNEFELLRIVSRAVKEMSEGELMQIEKARRLDITEEVYFEIIRQKTASLIASACAAGAASTTSDPALVEHMRKMGETIGLAFQIKDDLMDYGTDDIGKPRAIDIKEKKLTLPIIHTLRNAPGPARRRILNTIRNHNTDHKKVGEVIRIVRETGGLDYTRTRMQELRDQALEMAGALPETQASQAMRELIAFVIDRKQ
ncbi:MAG: polyprenyl synthetase family protein [Saprospiraceae bacterium]|nr:polyprenyl synthetase family protein [Saprospiraceae bacterium]